MIKKITLLSVSFLSICAVNAQKLTLVSENGKSAAIALTGHNIQPSLKTIGGIMYYQFNDAVFTMQKGAPQLPVYRTSVQLPDAGNVSVQVTYSGYADLEDVNILPSKGSLMRNVKPSDIAYEFGTAYNQDAFYPGKVAEAGNPYILRDTRGVTVSVYPYQYNPVTKVLRFYKDITIKVVTNGTGGANRKTGAAKPSNALFNEIYSSHYINARTLNAAPAPAPAEMLIIAPADYVETIAPLADWKIESGIKTTVVTLAETGDTAEAIKQYTHDFYTANPGLTYVLLVGDHEQLPSHTYGNFGEELWSDSYYGQLEGDDYYPEVFVGRFSGTVNDVANMVSRTLEYETAPLAGDWMTRFVGIGSDEGDGYGDDGEPDWQHLRNIGDKLLEYGYTYGHEFFDGSHGGNDAEEGPSNTMISDAINDGVGLINYTGHGATEIFATGWYSSQDVLGLTNTNEYPFVVSVACNNGTFVDGTSICEAWLTAKNNNNPTGAIAAAGSSILMAWAEPMQTQDEMAELITRSNPDVVKRSLGDLFYAGQVSMLQTYGESDTAIGVMQTWVFFGDPSVTYRNAPSQTLVAVHSAQIATTAQTLTVTSPVEGATVAVTQNGVVVGTGIVVNGQAVITLGSFDAAQPLTVTATMQNYTPYQGTVTPSALGVDGFEALGVKMYPNPAGAQLTIAHRLNSAQASYAVYDVMGKMVAGGQVPAGDSFVLNTAELSNGVYLVRLTAENGSFTGKFVKK